MADTQSHIIRRQIVELTLSSERDAYVLQDRLQQVYDERALPLLDRMFSELTDVEDVIRLDRVELDLGSLSLEALEEGFVEALQREVEELFIDRLKYVRHDASSTDDLVQQTTSKRSKLDSLLGFLRTGQVPWWTADPVSYDPERQLQELLDEQPEDLVRGLRSLRSAPTARRLARQVSRPLLQQLLQRTAPAVAEEGIRIARQLSDLQDREQIVSRSKAGFSMLLWEAIFAAVFHTEGQLPVGDVSPGHLLESIVEQIARNENRRREEIVIVMQESVARELPEASAAVRWLAEKVKQLRRINTETPREDESGEEPVQRTRSDDTPEDLPREDLNRGGEEGVRRPDDASLSQKFEAQRSDTSAREGDDRSKTGSTSAYQWSDRGSDDPVGAHGAGEGFDRPDDVDGSAGIQRDTIGQGETGSATWDAAPDYYIENAGLILLWPFLVHFFEHLHLMTEAEFASDATRERAVLLTQFLVTGETSVPEHLLILNKLLCGWPVGAPVRRTITPSTDEVEEAGELLTSVVTHWEALKNTSVDGLRQSFLIRKGKLTREEGHWSLKVDRKGYDMLLERLPWGIGLVKQPWMDKPISVEW